MWQKTLSAGILAGSMLVVACGSEKKTVTTCSTLPPPVKKASYTVGFSQIGSEGANPFRIAETTSMNDTAASLGVTLVVKDAANKSDQQATDMQDLIDAKVDAIFVAPHDQTTLNDKIKAARSACIPVFLIDRDVDHSGAAPGVDYVTFMGSDFAQEGNTIAHWFLDHLQGNLNVLQLLGTSDSTPAIKRREGFESVMMGQSRVTLLPPQPGNWERSTAKTLVGQALAAHPEINVIYAHNDEMGLGSIDAIKDSSNAAAVSALTAPPIHVGSMDGESEAISAVAQGTNLTSSGAAVYGIVVTTNPRFGPLAFATWKRYLNGESIPAWTVVSDTAIDSSNASDPNIQALGF